MMILIGLGWMVLFKIMFDEIVMSFNVKGV